MNRFLLCLTLLLVIAGISAMATVPASPAGACGEQYAPSCDSLLDLTQGQFSATPLMDGTMTDYGDRTIT